MKNYRDLAALVSIPKLLILNLSLLFLVTIFQAGFGSWVQQAIAAVTQNNNAGTFEIDFNDAQGIIGPPSPSFFSNIVIGGGLAQLAPGSVSGFITTSDIQPLSFESWLDLDVTSILSNGNDLQFQVIECNDVLTPVAGPLGAVQTLPLTGVVNLSSISSSSYPCLRIRFIYSHPDGSASTRPLPSIDNILVNWKPETVFLTSIECPATSLVGEEVTYQVRYSVSLVESNEVVVWVPLPPTTGPTYGQAAGPSFVSATGGGLYTASGLTIGSSIVPANSVYWNLGYVAEGTTDLLTFSVSSPNGLEDQAPWNFQSYVNSPNGEQVLSDADLGAAGAQACQTNLLSNPNPEIDKEVSGAIAIGDDRIIYNGGGFSGSATYTIRVENDFEATGVETIFNPQIVDDLSEILAFFNNPSPAGCGVGPVSATDIISAVSDAGLIDNGSETITWSAPDLADLGPGAVKVVSFTVDYTFGGCLTNLLSLTEAEVAAIVVDNQSTLSADNISPISDSRDVIFEIDLSPRGTYAKGDRIRGIQEIRAGRDDNVGAIVNYGELYGYLLYASNSGVVNLYENVFIDMIPAGVDFVSAALPSSVGGTIYYNTSNLAPFDDPAVAPPFDPANPALDGWTSIVPSPASDVIWVAFYTPCISSPFFPAPAGTLCDGVPSTVRAEINVQVETPADLCMGLTTNNIGHFFALETHGDISNNDTNIVASTLSYTDLEEEVIISPPVPGYVTPITGISGPSQAISGSIASYSINVQNDGDDVAIAPTVTINIPQLTVNGVLQDLPLASINAAGVVDLSTLALGYITVTFPNMPPGISFAQSISIEFLVPDGAFSNDSYTLSAQVATTDVNACENVVENVDISTIVLSSPLVRVFKQRDEGLIDSGGDIHYQLFFTNVGDAPSTNTYLVDTLPVQAVLEFAYTSPAVDSNGNMYSCVGCQVFFATTDPNLPSSISPITPIDSSDVANFFTPGVEVDPGTLIPNSGTGFWIPDPNVMATDQVRYIAFLVDDPSLVPPVVTAPGMGEVGFSVINDHDNIGSGAAGSPNGTLIRNDASVFSDELLIASGNQVITTVLDDPGLVIEKDVSAPVVGAGEPFTWTIEFYNDSSTPDSELIITDPLPLGVNLLGATFQWNSQTLVNDPSLPSGSIDLIADPVASQSVSISTVGGQTTIEVFVADVDGVPSEGLRGEDLAFLEGGTLTLLVEADPTLVDSGDVLLNEVVGCYSDATAEYCLTASELTTVRKPDLTISKFVSRMDPIPGEVLTYTLTFSNEGAYQAPDTVITDMLPSGLCFLSGPDAVLPIGWTIGAPSVSPGDCSVVTSSGTPTEIVFDNFMAPAGSGVPANTIPANSGPISITFSAMVLADAPPGMLFLNETSIQTSLEEEDIFPNEDEKDVTTPLPDPWVIKNSPATVLPGDPFNFTIQYGNASRIAASGVYILDTMPAVTLSGISGSNGEVFYCHDSTSGVPSVTDSSDPAAMAADGWADLAACLSAPSYVPTYLVIHIGAIPANGGPNTVTVGVEASDPNTGVPLPAATTMVNFVEIEADEDEDDSNNNENAITKTPGFDLYVDKSGSVEGGFPGTVPGGQLSYTIEWGNSGTEPACGVILSETLPTELTPTGAIHDFSILSLVDALGGSLSPEDPFGLPITSVVPIQFTQSGNTLSWEIGNPSTDVCIPPGATGVFQIFTTVNSDVPDSTEVENCMNIEQTIVAITEEDVRENNDDCTSVFIYRSDLTSSKAGFSCGEDGDCLATGDNSSTEAGSGDTLHFDISYNNTGNADAEDVVISEIIPTGTCYKVGSVEANQPTGTIVEYSDDGGGTWTYSPLGVVDCAVTNFRLVFTIPLPAPATFWGQGSAADFALNTQTDVTVIAGSDGNDYVTLPLITGSLTDQSQTTMEEEDLHFPDTFEVRPAIGPDGVQKFFWSETVDTDGSASIFFWRGSDMALGSPIAISPANSYFINPTVAPVLAFSDSNNLASVVWLQDVNIEDTDMLYWDETLAAGSPINLSQTATVDPAGLGTSGAVAMYEAVIDSAGVVHIAWIEYSGVSLEGSDVYYWNNSSQTTTLVSNRALSRSNAHRVNLVADSAGIAHISFEEFVEGVAEQNVFYWNQNLGSGGAVDISGSANVNGRSSFNDLLVSDSGTAHVISYESGVDQDNESDQGEGDMYYWNTNFTLAADSVLISPPSVTGEDENSTSCKFVVDSNDVAHVVWEERDSAASSESYDLYYYNSAAASTTAISDLVATEGDVLVYDIQADNSSQATVIFTEFIGAGNVGTYVWSTGDGANSPTAMANPGTGPGFGGAFLGLNDFDGTNISAFNINPVTGDATALVFANNTTTSEGRDAFFWDEASSVAGATQLLSDLAITEGSTSNGGASYDPSHVLNAFWSEQVSPKNQDMFFWDETLPAGSPYRITDPALGTGTTKEAYGGALTYDCFGEPVITWAEDTGGSEGFNVFRWNGALGDSPGIMISDDSLTNTRDDVGQSSVGELRTVSTMDGCTYTTWTEVAEDTSEGRDAFFYPALPASGEIQSSLIENTGCGNLLAWKNLIFDVEVPDGASITFDVLDNTGTPVPGFTGLFDSSGVISLSSLPATGATSQISLRARLTPAAGGCPEKALPLLDSWTVTMQTDCSPSFGFEVEVQEDIDISKITNTECIGTSTPELDSDNNCGMDMFTVINSDIRLDKDVDLGAIGIDGVPLTQEVLTYTIDYCNDGPREAINPVVTDALPLVYDSGDSTFVEAVTVLSAPPSCVTQDTDYTALPDMLICGDPSGLMPAMALPNLPAGTCASDTGDQLIIEVVVNEFPYTSNPTLLIPAGTLFSNSACVDSETNDPSLGNNCDTVPTAIGNFANVYIEKNGPAVTTLNGEVIYTLSYGNNGNLAAADVLIMDTPDANVNFVSAIQTVNTGGPALLCDFDGSNINCSSDGTAAGVFILPAGASGEIEITVQVGASIAIVLDSLAGTNLANSAMIMTTTVQTNISDDKDTHDIPVGTQGGAALGGFVFVDQDMDVVYEPVDGDSYIDGVSVFLLGCDAQGLIFGPDPVLYPAEYNSLMAVVLPDLLSNGIVPAGTTLSTLSTLPEYVIKAPEITGSNGTAGQYFFSGLFPADVAINGCSYSVAEVHPTAYLSTGSNGGQATISNNDSAAPLAGHGLGSVEGLGDVNLISNIQLDDSMVSVENNFGEILGEIGNQIWKDDDFDGVFLAGDQGIANVTFGLYADSDGNGVFDSTIDSNLGFAVSDSNGEYSFTDLALNDGSGSAGYFVVVEDDFSILDGGFPTIGTIGTDNNSQDPAAYYLLLEPTLAGRTNFTADFGYALPAEVGDLVWWDANQNGSFDGGETTISGVTVNIYNATSSTLVASTVSDGSGMYEFLGLDPSHMYYLEFVPPAGSGFIFTSQDISGNTQDNFDSDANASGLSDSFALECGVRNPSLDVGMFIPDVEPASLGDFVWFDTDMDGVQDPGESGVGGVQVNLIDALGNIIASTVSSASGSYEFTGLTPGTYIVEFISPPAYSITLQDSASNDISDSDVDPATGRTPPVTLSSGENNPSLDLGLTLPSGQVSELGDYVWLDSDGNGQQDSSESGVLGVSVTLYDASTGLPISTTTTNNSGYYLFDNLPVGDYYVVFSPPTGYGFTGSNIGNDSSDSDANSFSGQSQTVSLVGGDMNLTLDAGLVLTDPTQEPAGLGDYVWFDSDGNGIQDLGEEPAQDVEVILYDVLGNMLGMTFTDSNGFYQFVNLVPGTYFVEFVPPPGSAFTGEGIGGANDSDADPVTGRTGPISLGSGEFNSTIDAGLIAGDLVSGITTVMWNGFCDQQNIVALRNVCSVPVSVTVVLYGSVGGVVSSTTLDLEPGQEIDYSINDMDGFTVIDYGRADLISSIENCIEGEMGLFAPIGTGQYFTTAIGDYSFGGMNNLFAMRDGSLANACYFGFNTFQPSLNEEDAALPTTHYLQLVNLEPESKQSFTINRYDMDGLEIDTSEVVIPPGGRVDVAAGHQDSEMSRYGTIEVLPSIPGSNYTAQLFRYGLDSTVLSGERMSSFALADHCSAGTAETQYLTISKGAGASSYLELYNINNSSENVQVDIFSNSAGLVGQFSLSLGSLETAHLDTNIFLTEGETGVVRVAGNNQNRLLAKVTSYLYRADGKVLASETDEGRLALGSIATGSYNTFRKQLNWLRLHNISLAAASVTVIAFDWTGAEIGSTSLTLEANRGLDLGLNALFGLAEDQVGQLKIVTSRSGSIIADSVRIQHGDSYSEIQDIEIFAVKSK